MKRIAAVIGLVAAAGLGFLILGNSRSAEGTAQSAGTKAGAPSRSAPGSPARSSR
jgi:hypothetical protein